MLGKKNAKTVVCETKYKAYQNLYKKLDTMEGWKDIYKHAMMRERKCKELDNIKCIVKIKEWL